MSLYLSHFFFLQTACRFTFAFRSSRRQFASKLTNKATRRWRFIGRGGGSRRSTRGSNYWTSAAVHRELDPLSYLQHRCLYLSLFVCMYAHAPRCESKLIHDTWLSASFRKVLACGVSLASELIRLSENQVLGNSSHFAQLRNSARFSSGEKNARRRMRERNAVSNAYVRLLRNYHRIIEQDSSRVRCMS